MADSKGRASRITDYLIAFVLIYIVAEIVMRQFFPSNSAPAITGVILHPAYGTVRLGAGAEIINIHNGTAQSFTLQNRCPQPPFDVSFVNNPGSTNEQLTPLSATGTAIPCDQIQPMQPIAPGKDGSVSMSPWKYSLFSRIGTYQVTLPSAGTGSHVGTSSGATARFQVIEPNSFVKLFRAIITKPFLNFLILVASILPDHSLGVAIIILTLLVKLLLFIPTQHALEGQKKMQILQPKIEAVRRQYKDSPQKMQEETMKLWKEHKVNPLQSCLPILVQIPVLFGLLYVIRDDVNLTLSRDLIYPVFQHLSWNFNTNFLGLDLTTPNIWIFPILLVVLQFIQIKLSLMIADRKKQKQIEKAEEKTGMEMQQKVMLYVFPLMIGFFALKFPAAVSLYWGISTLFAIGQQMLVNREHIKA